MESSPFLWNFSWDLDYGGTRQPVLKVYIFLYFHLGGVCFAFGLVIFPADFFFVSLLHLLLLHFKLVFLFEFLLLLESSLFLFEPFFLLNLLLQFAIVVFVLALSLLLLTLDAGDETEGFSIVGSVSHLNGGFGLLLVDLVLEFLTVGELPLSAVILSSEEHL